ncbi:uncharacterized protein [Medicago truncatula]|uniref:uncharacterized protein isoform X2 n=1 Tax=Medicago truncatula TaxID=3880 RepID=UPI001967B4F8|nr:uncharacterized protein LOC11427224 isoform X2 [Medicago truncatula]
MSASSDDEEISNRNGYERGGSDGDDEQDEEDATGKKKKHRTKFDFGKRLVLNQFSKAKNQIRRVRSKKHLLSSSSSSTTITTASFYRNVNVSSRDGICLYCWVFVLSCLILKFSGIMSEKRTLAVNLWDVQ